MAHQPRHPRNVDVPPSNIEQGSLVALTPKGVHVTSWSPGRVEEQIPPTQVMLVLDAEEVPFRLAIRFRGHDTLDAVISALQEHRRYVWPIDTHPSAGVTA